MAQPKMTESKKPLKLMIKKINNEAVIPFKVPKIDEKIPIKGYNLFPELYSNIFICAKKKSGKTVLIQNIIQKCCTRDTTIVVFCSTINKDKNWIAIRKWCKKHGIPFEGFVDLHEGGKGKSHDILEKFLSELEHEGEEVDLSEDENEDNWLGHEETKAQNGKGFFSREDEEDEDDAYREDDDHEDHAKNYFFGGGIDTKKELRKQNLFDKRNLTSNKKDPKFRAPSWLFIFDDLSHDLRSDSITSLLKKNRHFLSKTICSSQYLKDLRPEAIKQTDSLILFRGQDNDKLEQIIKDCDLNIDLETLKRIYDDAVEQPFGFLYIDTRNCVYRKNFDKMYIVQ